MTKIKRTIDLTDIAFEVFVDNKRLELECDHQTALKAAVMDEDIEQKLEAIYEELKK